MSKSFVNLHAHMSYSRLDGASKIADYIARTKSFGVEAAAITDHGHLNGIIEFYRECKAQDVKPLLGQEFYFCDDRHVKSGVSSGNSALDGSDKRYYHLTVLARNNVGYHNLIKLSSDAFLEGFYFKPRADYSTLAKYSEGIIVGSGCLGGPVLQPLLHDDYDLALKTAASLQEIVGKDNFFIELMDHGLPEQAKTNPYLLTIAKSLGAPVCATQDTHYTHAGDATSHDALLCCQVGAKIADKDRFRFDNQEYYLKSPDQMYEIFSDHPEVCDNTLLIAEKCDVSIDFDTMHLPTFDVPEGFDSDTEYLKHLVGIGLQGLFGDNPPQEYLERIEYELGVIETMGVSSYFLILWDITEFCKRQGFLTPPGRGSAAGCLASYCLGITKVDPVKYGLIFERFLNPGRIALPDIDYDTEQRYREHIINYVREKYGDDKVAQIITFTKIKARTAVRDAARVLGFDFKKGDELAKAMPPPVSGRLTPLHACITENPDYESGFQAAQGLRDLYRDDSDSKKIIDVALGLEDLVRGTGVHAAAVVIGDSPLTDELPLEKNSDDIILTQWDKDVIEDLGYLKMDFLGLKTLDVLSDTAALVPEVDDIYDIPLDDPATYELLNKGDTVGVFQLGQHGMRSLVKKVKPSNIEEVAAVVALYRPGPMAANMHNDFADRKNGSQPAIPIHEDARDILSETYQLAIYQEQILFIARRFAGYSLSEADFLRKVLGKKLKEAMKEQRVKFVDGCVANGYDREFSENLFNMIDGFSDYSFNKSHALAYAFLAYLTAYFKTHHRKEFMATLCSSVESDQEEVAIYLADCRHSGMTVTPPDINTSNEDFTVTAEGIGVGLGLVRQVGHGLAATIAEDRTLRGPYRDVYDFVSRIDLNTQSLGMLASSGSLDSFGTRQGITSSAADILKSVKKDKKKVAAGQSTLFEDTSSLYDVEIPDVEYSPNDMLKQEKVSLGFYIKGHPIESFSQYRTKYSLADMKVQDYEKSKPVLCTVEDITVKYTRNNDEMAIVSIEDDTGTVEAVCFPRKWAEIKDIVTVDAIAKIYLKPGSDFRDERNYVLNGFDLIDSRDEQTDYQSKLSLYLPKRFDRSSAYMSKLKGLFLNYPGTSLVECFISRSTRVDLGYEYTADPCDELKEEVNLLFAEFRGNV